MHSTIVRIFSGFFFFVVTGGATFFGTAGAALAAASSFFAAARLLFLFSSCSDMDQRLLDQLLMNSRSLSFGMKPRLLFLISPFSKRRRVGMLEILYSMASTA